MLVEARVSSCRQREAPPSRERHRLSLPLAPVAGLKIAGQPSGVMEDLTADYVPKGGPSRVMFAVL